MTESESNNLEGENLEEEEQIDQENDKKESNNDNEEEEQENENESENNNNNVISNEKGSTNSRPNKTSKRSKIKNTKSQYTDNTLSVPPFGLCSPCHQGGSAVGAARPLRQGSLLFRAIACAIGFLV